MWKMRKIRIGGETAPEDWVIIRAKQQVGRVMLDRYPYNEAPPWKWSTWIHPAQNGREDSLEEAREAVRRAVLAAEGNRDE